MGQHSTNTRTRDRQRARAILNGPNLANHLPPAAAPAPGPAPSPAPPQPQEFPPIAGEHPRRWQVHRIEQHPGEEAVRGVLIAQTETEAEALAVARLSPWKVQITKWNINRRPYYSFAPVKVVAP